MAKERSELSKIVMRSSSTKMEKRFNELQIISSKNVAKIPEKTIVTGSNN